MLRPGERFGRATVLGRDLEKSSPGRAYYRMTCDCGNQWSTRDDGLRSGAVLSCGCKKKEHNFRHGHRRIGRPDRTYQTWDSMVQRCSNPKATGFAHYGGRGITVSKRWLLFDNFLADMGDRPLGKSLERKNSERGYTRSNCMWATQLEQMQNTRRTHKFRWRGRTWTLTELSTTYGVNRSTLLYRLVRAKWPMEKALEKTC